MKRITIIMVLLLCTFVLFGCKKEEKEPKKDAESIHTEDTVDDTLGHTNDKEEQTVVEDEVNMSENPTGKTHDNKTEQEKQDSSGLGIIKDDITSNPTTDTKEEDEDTSEKQRYDQDGDGFVDGWY